MKIERLFTEMYRYYSGEPDRIQHFIKVHSFASQIGRVEGLDQRTLQILETAAIVHDIGIKKSLEKYGSYNGEYQELEGPPEAKAILEKLDYPQDIIERVCYLVGNHHSFYQIDGADYQILVEADFLVNMHEGSMNKDTILSVMREIFRTKTAKEICKLMFQIQEI